MTRSIVIADASSLITLDNISEIEVLKTLYSKVTITSEVASDYGRETPSWIEIRKPTQRSTQREEISRLDPGEASPYTRTNHHS